MREAFCLGFFSSFKKKTKFRRWKSRYSRRRLYMKPGKAGKKLRRFNRKYKVVGATPNYWISPVDAIPGVAWYTKGKKAYKATRKVVRKTKAASKLIYKSRGKSSPQQSSRRNRPRGKFYYYRGKRIYYANRRKGSRRRRRY